MQPRLNGTILHDGCVANCTCTRFHDMGSAETAGINLLETPSTVRNLFHSIEHICLSRSGLTPMLNQWGATSTLMTKIQLVEQNSLFVAEQQCSSTSFVETHLFQTVWSFDTFTLQIFAKLSTELNLTHS